MSSGGVKGGGPAQLCLASREVYPLTGGGIGSYVTALAGLLREIGRVRVITSEAYRPQWERLTAAGDPRLPEGVAWTFVPEPDMEETGDWFGFHHMWSARVLQALEEEYGRHGPAVVEFPDYHGEGFVTAQAKRAGHATLRDTHVAVRAHTSFEMCRTLDGYLGEDRESEYVCALERGTLALADSLLWAGGDILGTYQRFYGAQRLPADLRIRHPLAFSPPAEGQDDDYVAEYPIRLLYLGRLERRKGVQDLVRALMANDSHAWSLTLVGGDTATGPLGVSQRGQLEVMTLGDERVTFLDAVPRHELPALIREHDVLAMPSRWECWPTVALEAMALNRPVLGTPTGGMLEMVQPESSGWLTSGVGARPLTETLEGLLGAPERVEAVIRSGGPARRGIELTRDGDVVDAYARLAGRPAPPARPRGRPRPVEQRAAPLVSVVVTYFQLAAYVGETLASIGEQTHPCLETIVVNDGSRSAEDSEVLEELAARPGVRVLTTPNRGLGGARNAGIVQSRGRYVVPLDADNLISPTFVERCVELLESDPAIAYVTCWSRYIDEDGEPVEWPGSGAARGYHPLGNATQLVERTNTAGDALAVLPRRLFDLGFRYSEDVPICEDWMLYRALRRSGRFGVVIPERLVSYRVRRDSMYQTGGVQRLARVHAEATAQLDEEAIAWTP